MAGAEIWITGHDLVAAGNEDAKKILLDIYNDDNSGLQEILEQCSLQAAQASARQHCRLSICENWLSWTNTETAAATPPTVMQNLLRASAQ